MTSTRNRPRLASLAPILLVVMGLSASAARGADSPAQKEVRQRRLALLKAVNAHDVKAIRGFLDPSYTGKTRDGRSMGFQQSLDALGQLFRAAPDLKETLKIEKITVTGDTAEVSNVSTLTLKDPQGKQQQLEQRYLQTWKRLRGRWLVVAEREL